MINILSSKPPRARLSEPAAVHQVCRAGSRRAGAGSPRRLAGLSGEHTDDARRISSPAAGAQTDELGDPLTSFEDVTNYNNFYEFSQDKQGVAPMSADFKTRPWTLAVGGLVNKPRTFAIEDLLAEFPRQERIYRLRCVEAWSMVIPWMGFPLANLLKEVEPSGSAKYVRFETLLDPEQMPGQKSGWFTWPYVEGLRLDEAMHDLTLLATGLYGKELLPQNGAPLRLVVPWKYGFKNIKSIVKIDLVAEQPTSVDVCRAERVRLLCQRQSGRRSPTLVAVQRAAHRWIRAAQDTAVQWLRGGGSRVVCWNGFGSELLGNQVIRQ